LNIKEVVTTESKSNPVVLSEGGGHSKKWIIIGVLFAIPLVVVLGVSLTKTASKSKTAESTRTDWLLFRELDLTTGRPSERLAALDGKRVRAPGFMVPLEDNRSEVTEYLLVPNPQACIHAPPPPSNQMIYVRMVGEPAKMIYGPVWVEGTLRVASQTHQYGNAGFQIYGEVTSPYRDD